MAELKYMGDGLHGMVYVMRCDGNSNDDVGDGLQRVANAAGMEPIDECMPRHGRFGESYAHHADVTWPMSRTLRGRRGDGLSAWCGRPGRIKGK